MLARQLSRGASHKSVSRCAAVRKAIVERRPVNGEDGCIDGPPPVPIPVPASVNFAAGPSNTHAKVEGEQPASSSQRSQGSSLRRTVPRNNKLCTSTFCFCASGPSRWPLERHTDPRLAALVSFLTGLQRSSLFSRFFCRHSISRSFVDASRRWRYTRLQRTKLPGPFQQQ